MPMPATELRLLDDDGKEVRRRTAGRDRDPRPQVMAGYWQRPDETAKVMTADGFFRTGDIGTVDARGYFRIVDRKKDMILVSGFNVYPNEVEEVVGQMPGVLECAAVGVPDERTGEAVKLVVVRKKIRRWRIRRAQLLRVAPGRLQAAEGGRVPRRPAEDASRQDPAPRAARQGLKPAWVCSPPRSAAAHAPGVERHVTPAPKLHRPRSRDACPCPIATPRPTSAAPRSAPASMP
jgi:hypothetical protein